MRKLHFDQSLGMSLHCPITGMTTRNCDNYYYRKVKKKLDGISVEIRFDHVYTGAHLTLSHVECVYWDTEARGWNTTGCRIIDTSHTSTTCHCQHLTNFAVLMDINGVFSDDSDDISDETTISANNSTIPITESYKNVLNYMTLICSTISIIFLAFCIWIFR